MRLILNESKIIEKSLNEGYIDKKPTVTLKLLAKHYFSIGMDRKQVRDCLELFMMKNYDGFNSVKWSNILDRLVKYVQKLNHELLNIESVNIYKNELQTIKNIKNTRLERLAFILLVYSKIYNIINKNKNNWVNASLKDIFSDCKMAVSSTEQCLMMNKLYDMGLIELSKKVDCTNIKVKFANENCDVSIVVNDFRDYVYYYLEYTGEKIGKCESCGKLVKAKANSHKYCKSCAKEIWNEQHKIINRNHMRKKRNVDIKENTETL
jgi:hypothetical protein